MVVYYYVSNYKKEGNMKKRLVSLFMSVSLLLSVLASSALLSSCATVQPTSQRTYEGAGVGAAVGSVAGLLIDKDNRWRGAVIGGLLGAALGGTVTEISQRAAREAAYEGRPVAYQSNDGYQRVEATPVSYDAGTKCHKVRERIWQDGKLVKDEIREICDSERADPGYY
jgi:hypothetical protein